MPHLNGLDTTRQLLQYDPNFKVIVLTITDSYQVIREALDAGARGFVLKSDAARGASVSLRLKLCRTSECSSPRE